MKGMGQIVTWSVRDETLHCNSMIRFLKNLLNENPEIGHQNLKKNFMKLAELSLNMKMLLLILLLKWVQWKV